MTAPQDTTALAAQAIEKLRLRVSYAAKSSGQEQWPHIFQDEAAALVAVLDERTRAAESAEAALADAREALARATFIAAHLMEMIDPQTWRDYGGDDGQGHYEGDYRAEQTAVEIQALAALARGVGPEEAPLSGAGGEPCR